MRRLFFTILFTAAFSIGPAFAQEPEKMWLSVTKPQLQVIGQGLMELPYKTSVEVLNELNRQVAAQNLAEAEKAKARAEAAAEAAAPKKADRVEPPQ